MEKIYHNFAGMDLDTSPEKFNPNYYSTAYNVRIGSNIGSLPSEGTDNKKGSLEGLKGINATLSGLFTDVNCKIIALTKIRDNVVFILSTETTQSIYNILETDLKNSITPIPFFTWNKSSLTLNEDATTILGRYETDKLIKVYITDGDTYLKSINLAVTAPTDIKQLEVFKPVIFTTSPDFTVSSGGSLKAGNVVYGAQFYSLNGSASNYIHIGNITPILKGDINDSAVLTGGALNETTDKMATITIPPIDGSSGLNYAKVARIHYSVLGEMPSISVVYDGAISNTSSTIITDSGQFIESVTPEEYALITNPFKCKTIEQKNNILFAGNILQQEFDIEYDARVRRYNYIAESTTNIPAIYNSSFNVNVSIGSIIPSSNVTVTYSNDTTPKTTTFSLPSYTDWTFYVNKPSDVITAFNNAQVIQNPTDTLVASAGSSYFDDYGTGNFTINFTANFALTLSNIVVNNESGYESQLVYLSSTKTQNFSPAGSSASSVYSGDFNPYNDPTKTTFTDGEKYSYQSDGHTIGGTGVNGSYAIYRTNIPIYNTITNKPVYTDSPFNKNFQRGEIYGFALVGFDEYLRPSFAKFIDDIKIPGYNEVIEDRLETQRALNTTISNVIHQEAAYINFGFNNLPSSIKYCTIVRTSREGGDGTITDMGVLTSLWSRPSPAEVRFKKCSATETTFSSNSESTVSYYEFVSPKLLTNGSLPTFDRVDYFYTNSGGYKQGNLNRVFVQNNQRGSTDKYYTETYSCDSVVSEVGSDTCADKQYFSNSSNKDALLQVGGENIMSWLIFPEGDTNYRGFKSRCGVVKFNSTINAALPSGTTVKTPFCVLKKTTYPYGGYTQPAIEQRNWIISSPIYRVVSGSVTLSTKGYGDTYSQMVPYTRTMWNVVRSAWGEDVNAGQTCYIPFESQVLMKGVAGKTFDNYFVPGVDVTLQPFRLIQENKGVWTDDSNDTSLNSFTQNNDLYGYNSAYSTNNSSKVYITKPSVYSPQSKFDCTVYNSDRKINGELVDSWTIFRPNNKIELDTSRGSLTSLVNLNNTLFFIQESGAGTLAVDERELIPSSNTGSLYLGTGGVLSRFDYIFTNYGAKSSHSIDSTNNFIYFYDSAAGKFCRMNTQQADIMSDTMNCKSYFSKLLYSLPQNPNRQYYVGADNIKQELYLKPSDGNGIVFNELWNSFSSLTTIPFNKIFTTKDIMYFTIPYSTSLSPFTGNGGYLYSLASYSNMDVTNEHANDLEYSLDKSVEFISSGQVPMRLDLVEWTSSNYTPLSNTDIEEKYEIYQEDVMFKEFSDSNSNPNPRFFNKKRYNQIYNVNNRQRCKGNYFKIKYIGNYDKLKKSNFTLNSFNVYITPLLNR